MVTQSLRTEFIEEEKQEEERLELERQLFDSKFREFRDQARLHSSDAESALKLEANEDQYVDTRIMNLYTAYVRNTKEVL